VTKKSKRKPRKKVKEDMRGWATKCLPTQQQVQTFWRTIDGCKRVYNLAVEWGEAERAETKKVPKTNDLKKRFRAFSKHDPAWAPVRKVYSKAIDSVFEAIGNAYSHALRRLKEGPTKFKDWSSWPRWKKDEWIGWPSPKDEKNPNGSFEACVAKVEVTPFRVILPPYFGSVRLAEQGYIPTGVYTVPRRYVCVRYYSGSWYISIQLPHQPKPVTSATGPVVLDICRRVSSCSDGTSYCAPMPYCKEERAIADLQRQQSHKRKHSRNWRKIDKRIKALHRRVAAIRNAAQHECSSDLVRRKAPSAIVSLRPKVKEEMAPSEETETKRAKAERNKPIADTGCYEFWRQVDYKARWAGIKSTVVLKDGTAPSPDL